MTLSPKVIVPAVVALTAALTLGATPLLRETLHYPTLTMAVGSELQLSFVQFGTVTAAACEERLAKLETTMRKNCAACRTAQKRCVDGWSGELQRAFSADPLDIPAARLPDGVLMYASATPGLALATCQASERQTATAPPANRVRCFPAGTPRPR